MRALKTDGNFREKIQEPLIDTVVLPASLQQRAFQDHIIIFLEIQLTSLKDNIGINGAHTGRITPPYQLDIKQIELEKGKVLLSCSILDKKT